MITLRDNCFLNLIYAVVSVGFERAVGKNDKLESFKLESLKLETCAEVGKNQVI